MHRAWFSILALAAALRLWAVGFGLPLLLKPDENRMVEVAYAMGDARFVHWFLVYPHLLFILEWALFMAVAAGGIAFGYFGNFKAFRIWRNGMPHVLHLISRLPVVAFGVATPWVTGALARHHGGPAVGWLAGLLIAVLPMHVKESMYFSVDVPMVFAGLVSLWCALEAAETGSAKKLILGGLAGGLAAGFKYPAAVLAVPLTVAWALGRRRHGLPFVNLVACGALMIGAFVITTPIILKDPMALVNQIRILSGRLGQAHCGIELGPGWQYHLTESMPVGFTWPVVIAGAVGLLCWGRSGSGWVLTCYLAAFFFTFARSHTVFQRYALPLAPVLCLFAARAGVAAWERSRPLGLVVVGALIVAPLATSLQYVEFLGRTDTRVIARAWLEEHIPAGTRVACIGSAWVDVQLQKDFDQEDIWRPERQAYLREGRALGLTRFLPPKSWHITYADDLAAARKAGCTIAVVADHPWQPLSVLPPGVHEQVQAAGERLFSLDPIRPGAPPARYDAQDAWMVPTAGWSSLAAPGPRVWVYRLR